MGHDLRVVEKDKVFMNTVGGMDGEPGEEDRENRGERDYAQANAITDILRRSALGMIPEDELSRIAWQILSEVSV